MPAPTRKTRNIATMILLPVFIFLSSFSVRSTEPAGNLTNFRVMDAGIGEVLQGLGKIGGIRVLLDRRTGPGPRVNIKFRDGIEVAEAVEQLARTYGYSYQWDLPARTVIVGNDQTFKDYENMETRAYDPGSLDREELITLLTAAFPAGRLQIEPAGKELKIRTSILEHQMIGELLADLRNPVPDMAGEISVLEMAVEAWQSLRKEENLSLFSGSPEFIRVSREQAAAIKSRGELRERRALAFTAPGNRENLQFIGDLLPVVTETEEGTRIEYRKVGVDLAVTSFSHEHGVTVVLQTEVNRIKGWREAGGTAVPVLESERAGTVINLAEGESLVVSGLNLVSAGGNWNGIQPPTDLPLLGRLFSSLQEFPGGKTELCILITPSSGGSFPPETAAAAGAAPVFPSPSETPQEQEIIRIELVEEQPETAKEETPPAAVPAVTARPGQGTGGTLWEVEVVELGGSGKKDSGESSPPLPVPPTAVPETPLPVEKQGETGKSGEEMGTKEPRRPLAEETEPAVPVGLTIIYRVQSGDTIAGIARRYGIPVETIIQANNLSSFSVPGGTDLIIPIPANHLYPLQAGETLWRLAKRYGVTVELLMDINQISEVTQLTTGQIIILPRPVDQIVDDRY